jgi:hypothetical protein
MRRLTIPALVVFFLLATVVAVAQRPQAIMPKLITNATWVYVTSYDGAEPNPRISPEDLQAISTVQDALKSWGKYKLVYRPEAAEIIILVHTSRPWGATRGHWDDEMAIYDARNWRESTWLWREMAIDGLQGANPPLVESFRHQVEQAEVPERPGYALVR